MRGQTGAETLPRGYKHAYNNTSVGATAAGSEGSIRKY